VSAGREVGSATKADHVGGEIERGPEEDQLKNSHRKGTRLHSCRRDLRRGRVFMLEKRLHRRGRGKGNRPCPRKGLPRRNARGETIIGVNRDATLPGMMRSGAVHPAEEREKTTTSKGSKEKKKKNGGVEGGGRDQTYGGDFLDSTGMRDPVISSPRERGKKECARSGPPRENTARPKRRRSAEV